LEANAAAAEATRKLESERAATAAAAVEAQRKAIEKAVAAAREADADLRNV
jgi:hypothetical protein